MVRLVRCLAALALAVAVTPRADAADPMPQHPFMLWTKQDIAAIKKKIDAEPWARKAYEELLTSNNKLDEPFRNLLQYAVDGDQRAGDVERSKLMKFVDAPHPLGAANELTVLRYDILHDSLSPAQKEAVKKKFREYLDYSVIHNGVLDKERFPDLFNDSKKPPFSRYDKNPRLRHNWLPNIIFPRQISANLMALALRDPALVRQVWERPGTSLKWYFDESLADSGFYSEEFSKMGATPGALLMYCTAAKNAGMNELGFGYTGKGGATMKGHIYSLVHIAYPKVDLGSNRPQIPTLTSGDLRGPHDGFPAYALQQNLVTGYLPGAKSEVKVTVDRAKAAALGVSTNDIADALRQAREGKNPPTPADLAQVTVKARNGQVPLASVATIEEGPGEPFGGNQTLRSAGAWGGETRGKSDQWDNEKTPKLFPRYWFEIAHKEWPNAGFDYFLAQMRGPNDDKFFPSLYFGLDPIDPAEARKHAPPAPSALHPQRGVAMLRAEESPAYWDSPAPAVGVRLAAPYAHAVNDPFTIAGFVAFNRPFYINRHTNPSYAAGWTRSIESHAGIVVGFSPAEREAAEARVAASTVTGPFKPHARHLEPQFDADVTTATHFSPVAKYLGMRSDGTSGGTVYKGVDFSRQFILTREYLLDVSRVLSPDARDYHWLAHALGHQKPTHQFPAATLPPTLSEFTAYRADAPSDKELAVTIEQSRPREGVRPRMPESWYEKALAMEIRFLPDPAGPTSLGIADTPLAEKAGPDEFGGTSVILTRAVPANTPSFFVAIHHPQEKTTTRLGQITQLARTDAALALSITHAADPGAKVPPRTDLLFLSLPGKGEAPVTLTAGDTKVTFVNFAMLRAGSGIDLVGDVRELEYTVGGDVALMVNGKPVTATIEKGKLRYSAPR